MDKPHSIPLAVVGMSCRLPRADGLDEFWTLLAAGRSAVAETPHERLNRKLYYDPKKGVQGKSYTTIGCLVDYPPPDLSICPLTEAQIASHDPAHVTMVEIAAKACIHAGLDPFAMPKVRAGVYVGHTRGSPLGGDLTYAHLVEHTAQYLRDINDFSERTGSNVSEVINDIVRSVHAQYPKREPGQVPNFGGVQAAGLVARALKLDGPFMAVNAACASSLQALSLAAHALELGEIDLAIVGGAAYFKVDSLILFSYAQSVSATGSRPFDADADGLVNGEGYVTLVIEPLERALANRSRIHAVIRGIGMSCDGSGKSLWAPRKEGQIAAMQRAYDHGVDMNSVQYIEAHATSTQVGDTTELAALGELLNERLPEGTKIPVGSVKANIGHTIETSGLAGLLKTILSLKHRTIPPAINVETLNPKIDWTRMPFYVPRTAIPWPEQPDGQPRCAGVNSFGIGGLNVHVVVQEFAPSQESAVRSTARHTETPGAGTPSEEPIAVIGMGVILPGALNTETYWELLIAGHDPKQNAPRARLDAALAHVPGARIPFRTPTLLGGFITDFQYDWRTRKIPPKQIANADPLQFMLLDAVEQALQMCGHEAGKGNHERTGVYIGALTAGEFHEQLQMGLRLPEFQEELARALRRRAVPPGEIQAIAREFGTILLERMPALLDETGSYTTNTLASRITKTFNFMGGAAAIDAGTASAAAALSASVNCLRVRDCDVVVCAAGQRAMGPAAFELFSLEGKLSLGAPRSPFDAQASGFVPGEGAAAVVLKRLSDARRDGDEILGLIRGLGAARDGSYESAVGEAIRRGLVAARIDGDRVSCMETVGRSEPTLDAQEFKALLNCFGRSRRPQPVALGSITSQLGQLGAAHAMAGLIKILLALRHGRFPGNVALTKTSPLFNSQAVLAASKDSLAVSPPNGDTVPPVAGLSSCADAQLVYHIVVEGFGKNTSSPSRAQLEKAQWRIFRFEGHEPSELVAQLNDTASNADREYRSAEPNFALSHSRRLAIVAESPADLAEKCALAGSELMQRQAQPLLRERGIFSFENGRRCPRVVFLFPGQGSQYAGMLRSLVQEFEPAQQAVSDIDEVLSRLGYPSVARVLWEEGEQLGKSVWRTQLSLLIADTVFYLCLAALQIFPERVASHSFGEFAALIAAGAWNFENAARATRARSAAIEASHETQGIMMSVNAPAAVVEERLGRLRGRAYVACYNAPEQTVLAGSHSALLDLAEQLARDKVLARIIDTPAAFHTPLMEAVKAPFGKALAELVIEPPTVPVLSSVHGRYMADPDDIRTTLVAQMTTPVRYLDLVRRLAREGTEVFVEVGPHQVLTRLNRQILKDSEVIAIGTDQPKKNPLQQLLSIQACLESAGAVEWSPDQLAARVFQETRTVQSIPRVATRGRAAESAQNRSGFRPKKEEAPAHPLNRLELSGTPYDTGLQHGRAHSSSIRTVLRRYADLAGSWGHDASGMLEAPAQPKALFEPAELKELEGIADGAGVPLATIITHNVRLQSGIGGCTQFAVTAEHNDDAGLIHCVNEDQTLARRVRGCLIRSLQVRFPEGGIPALIFGTVGQMGGFSGINARGLAVSSAQMLDTAPSRTTGSLHAAIVKRILEGTGDIDEALALLESTNGTGAWALCLSHYPTDELCYAEYNGNAVTIQRHQSLVVGANHSLLGQKSADAVPHSGHRLRRLEQLLDEARKSPGGITIHRAQAALRDRFDLARGRETPHPTTNTVCRLDNHMSLVMQPAQGKVWAVASAETSAKGTPFVELDVRKLLASGEGAPAIGGADPETAAMPASPQLPTRESTGAEEPPVCQRLVPQLVETTHPREERRFLEGPALILGANPVAHALKQKIEASGGTAFTIPASADLENTLARVDELCRLHLPQHLFLLTPCDAEARTTPDRSRWQRRRILGVSVPYFVCQRWYQFLLEAGRITSASVMGVTRLGGDFGFSGSIHSAESGAITGLIKACKREVQANGQHGFTAKVIDMANNDSAEETVRAILRELGNSDEQTEVSWAGERRSAVRAAPRAASRAAHPVNTGIARGAVWLVTGGARGITAAAARELARNHDLKLHLIGSSPLPSIDKSWHQLSEAGIKALRTKVMKEALARGEVPIAAWNRVTTDLEIVRNLDAYTAAGVRFSYHCCDITDYDRVRSVLQEIRDVDGPLEGILHGAAFESAIRFDKKRSELVERTIAVKVDGAAHLMNLTRNDPVRHFIAFGSISGRFGGIGQTDYSLANDFMAKLVSWYGSQRPDAKTTTFHWHAWDDVGMAVRPETSYLRRYSDIRYMPAREGICHFMNEVSAGLPEREVVVTDVSRCKDVLSPHIAHHESKAPRYSREGAETDSSAPDVSHLPLIDAIKDAGDGTITAELCMDPTKDPFLAQHLFKGRPLMPGVISIAAMAQAASILLEEKKVTLLRNIEFVAPLRFHTDRKQVARLHAALEARDVACRLTADFVNRAGQVVEMDRLHARAVVGTLDGPSMLRYSAAERPVSWHTFQYPADGIISHGEDFRCLKAIWIDEAAGWGRLKSPSLKLLAGPRTGDRWIVSAAALDAGFVLCAIHTRLQHRGRVFQVPRRVERLVLVRQSTANEELYVRAVLRSDSKEHTKYDFTILDEEGCVVAEVCGYTGFMVSDS